MIIQQRCCLYDDVYIIGYRNSINTVTFRIVDQNGDTLLLNSKVRIDDIELRDTGLAADFGSNGLWHYENNLWRELNGQNPESMVSWAGGLAADFGDSGL